MRIVVDNAIQDGCCTFSNKLEFIFDNIEKADLEDVIQFLYSGQILFSDQAHAAKVLSNLTHYLGFPDFVEQDGGIKQEGIMVDEDLDLTFDYGKFFNIIGIFRGEIYLLQGPCKRFQLRNAILNICK